MDVSSAVQKMREEISGRKRKEIIDFLEEILIENIEELSENESFILLPLEYIFSVISKVDLAAFGEKSNILKILQNFIKNTIIAHYEEKETLMLLHSIDTTKIYLSFEEIMSILEYFSNCTILNQLCYLYKEKEQIPDLGSDYQYNEKYQEIEKLKHQINCAEIEKSYQVLQKPKDLESDIFKACKEGKLTSVQWLVEK